MEQTFIESLQMLREEHIAKKNVEFNEQLKKIVENAIARINIDEIREHIINKTKAFPGKSAIEVNFKFSLDELFTTSRFWSEGKLIENSKQPLEVWFYDKNGNLINYICNYTLLNHFNESFCDYLYSTQSDIQKIKNIFKLAFPEAKIRPWVFIHSGSESFMRISITHEFTSKIQAAEPFVVLPFRTSHGEFVIW